MTVSINLNSRSKPVKSSEIKLDKFSSFTQVCIKDIKAYIHSTYRLDPSRQRLTTADKKVLDDPQKSLGDYGLKEGDQILFKDLGPQISWRMVFLIEYFGPLLIHPLFYLSNPISNMLYGGPVNHSRLQNLAFGMVMIHFLKRELETILVHRFSNATMPFRNIFKNSFHYWVLSGFLLAGPIYGHASSAVKTQGSLLDSSVWLYAWSAVWAFAEVSNLLVHLHLRSLRPAGSKKRSLPLGGYGFSLVCCPNYSFETLAWFSYTAMVGFHWAGCLFSLISFIQMALWSAKKLKNYRQEFKGQVPSHWKSIIPFVF
ncbi:3-oxo-5a-steroid 4- dehydrogenase [Puccinia graminis f. sp. tritici]|uniref:3-oxo-5a-steroid 4-dehydrogenase n=1 Tax=Puccinia graminis f. sp. tritici TaxID=56615 RepID=A0A5B0N1U6_PUCGR|nr:3-oxo-5a-steroid 4- dehydrogenase [Puccinia graminis f. sp. tritici]KAA1082259.1 3-oxo-5a-steroid 4- dehydrogenase [Puccinia graminis f. sp. tritici]KAA1082506.1 3-oxo-5a-steroid 4- dehydrogenase [Puccinia graminis f. sp. tritici]KAA1133596.1 3-oxo-5a-steroid 4- dehydrogenase [Puccinia graminis f. sp. tritici]